MTGQEERDVLFACLFGLTAVVQSGLLVRTAPLPTSPASPAATLASYRALLEYLLALGEKKSWLRESAWWAIVRAVDAVDASEVAWRDEALEATVEMVYGGDQQRSGRGWSPEMVALTLRLQKACPEWAWKETLAPTFKHVPLLHTGNYAALARVMKVCLQHFVVSLFYSSNDECL
jgi:DNA polymerase phi